MEDRDKQWIQRAGMEFLGNVGAVLTGTHVVYTSGRKHGSEYVNKDEVFWGAEDAYRICHLMAALAPEVPDVVIGPEMGGIGYALLVALHFGGKVKAAYAEKDGNGFRIRATFASKLAGLRVLVVEDILNTGGSAAKVIKAVREVGGEVIGVVAICNRGGVTAEQLDVPFVEAVVEVSMETFEEDACPLCAQGVPINTTVGHGADFLARKAKG